MAGILIKNGLKTAVLDSILNQVRTRQSRYYYCLGQPASWPDEGLPPNPLDSAEYEKITRRDIVLSKIIDPANIASVTRRIDWEFGKIFDFYDDQFVNGVMGAGRLEDADFYTVNSELNVYKCLSNNGNRPSTVEPAGIDSRPFTTSDGYTWKYMYTVNPSQKNKFLSTNYIPVSNPLLQDFFKKGSINNISIRNIGAGYTTPPAITVIGDGFLEENPFEVNQVNLNQGGSGYTSPAEVTIEAPYSLFVEYMAGQNVLLGVIVRNNNNYYRVDRAGILGPFPPTHTSGTVTGSTVEEANLTYVATGASVQTTTETDQIGSVFITKPGSGYTSAPAVMFAGGGGIDAAAVSDIQIGQVVNIVMSDFGSGYTSAPTVDIGEPFITYTDWSDSGIVTSGTVVRSIVSGNTYYYTAQNNGTLGSVAPSHTTGTVANGTVNLLFSGQRAEGVTVRGRISDIKLLGFIKSIRVINGGSGYTQGGTSVQILGSGTGAVAIPVVQGGVITQINVVSQGSGYLEESVSVVITGDGTGAVADAVMGFSFGYNEVPLVVFPNPIELNGVLGEGRLSVQKSEAIIEAEVDPIAGVITSVRVLNGGVGYTFARIQVVGDGTGAQLEPLIDFGDFLNPQIDTQLLSVPGSISGAVVQNKGVGYTTASVQIIGDGTGATAVANILDGQVDTITILNIGENYTFAEAVITGDGTGATARIILAPAQGHGFNPMQELFSKGIAFYSSFSTETNQGIFVDNEYRQISIIKDPFQYGRRVITQDSVPSTCFLVQTNYDGGDSLLQDDILQKQGSQSTFRIIETVNGGVLVQSLGQDDLVNDDVLTITKSGVQQVYVCQNVSKPRLDKYSGELVFIDNIRSFKFNSEQIISIRSIIEIE